VRPRPYSALSRACLAILAYAIVTTCAPVLAQSSDPPDAGRQAYEALRTGDLTAAEAGFRAAIKANAKDIASYVGLAQTLLRLKKPKEALEAQRQAVALNPTSADLRLGLAGLLEESGDSQGAIGELRRATKHAPLDPRAWVGLSGALRRTGLTSEARQVCVRALGIGPDLPALRQEMAEIAEATEDWRGAVAHYEAIVRLQPAFRPARLAHLGALSNAGRWAEARRIAQKMLAATPDDADVRLALASALEGMAERDAAIAEYRKVLEADPKRATAWGNLGWTQYQAGRLDDAIQSSRKALELDQSLAYVQFNLGLIYAAKGDWPASEVEYAAAIRSGEASDLRAAIADVEAALARRPNDATLGRALDLLKTAQSKRR